MKKPIILTNTTNKPNSVPRDKGFVDHTKLNRELTVEEIKRMVSK